MMVTAAPMTAATAGAFVRRYFTEVDRYQSMLSRDWFTSDYQLHMQGVPGPLGVEEAIATFTSLYLSFPDLTHTVEDVAQQGDLVFARLTVRGSQMGEFMGFNPTNREVEIPTIVTLRIRDGQIAEHHIEYDGMLLMQQLGFAPTAD